MANWLHQLQSLLGQQSASPSGESSKGSGLLPGAIGGIDALSAEIDERLPRPEVELRVLLPYDRGDLVDRIHRTARIVSLEHTGEGTQIHARVRPDLADELAPYRRD